MVEVPLVRAAFIDDLQTGEKRTVLRNNVKRIKSTTRFFENGFRTYFKMQFFGFDDKEIGAVESHADVVLDMWQKRWKIDLDSEKVVEQNLKETDIIVGIKLGLAKWGVLRSIQFLMVDIDSKKP